MKNKLPKMFRACCWDEGWDFDMPCILYEPFYSFGYGGNSGELKNMIENFCIDYAVNGSIKTEKEISGLKEESEWRGWDLDQIRKKKNAIHLEVIVEWYKDEDGLLAFRYISEKQQKGPFEDI